ncbi:MAG TPA: PucR family transcriptional regulator ligand-binding domain-containing protein [Trebonia sp.]|nr:PucR family transcriptional regulator ligand-binding domain-containing protein [Trebonia sp.]
MPLTLREVLDLDVVRRGQPEVVAAADRLDVPVRWVHAIELTDVKRLLRGGELVLSTGIALPDSAAGLEAYVAELAGARVCGLAIELGRRYAGALPAALADAAADRGVPLIAFAREVPFVEITEAVHARIIDALLIERAATTLALGRLLTRQAESLERQAHRTLISALIEPGDGHPAGTAEAEARARSMGVPVTGRQLVAVVVRLSDAAVYAAVAVPVLEVAEAVAAACRQAGVPALAGALDDLRAGALLSLPSAADAGEILTALAGRLGDPVELVIGAGPPVTMLRDVRMSFLEARDVADVAILTADGRPYYRLADLRLRGLLHLLRDDARLRAFAGRELGPLVAYDAAHGMSLVSDLAAYLECGGNKALAAARAHVARPTFYERLRHIERVLGVSLANPESRTCLHVALLSLKPDEQPQ